MRQKPFSQRIGDFLEGKGFYIVLFLCITAIGISGYFLLSGMAGQNQTLANDPATQSVTGQVDLEVPQAPVIKAPTYEPEHEPDTEVPPEETQDPPPEEEPPTVYTWPVRGTIARDYSLEVFAYDETMGDWRTHCGLDIETELGTQVMATTNGTVAEVYLDDLMGTTVIIDHGDGLQSVYANLAAQPTVAVGDAVETGSIIGSVGDTAKAESAGPPHLHFEMRQDGVSTDPTTFLPEGS